LISIIIPSFNNLSELKKCILSIQNQTFKQYEVWVIDNESTDGTIEYIKTLKAPFYWKSENDKGVYDAMNKGVSLATKEWLYFMGADDMFYKNTTLEEVFLDPISDQFKLIIGNIKYNLKIDDIVYTHTKEGIVKPSWSMKLWIKNSVHHQATFYRKEVFEMNNYSLKYKILADHDLNLRLYNKKAKAKTIDKIVAICGTGGLSKNYNKDMYKEEVRLKVAQSSILLKPIFVSIGFLKHIVKLSKL